MTKTRTILSDIYDAWRAQDLDRLGSYLPDEFCHMIHIPTAIHPLGGMRQGKGPALERLRQIFEQFDFVRLDTERLMIEKDHAAAEIPTHCLHRATRASYEATKANFWTLEEGWPVQLTEYYDVARLQAFMSSLAALEPS